MAEPTIQLGGGNWAGKTDNLLGYYKEGERFYKQDFTFSRSTTGTYTDSEGYIQEMPYNKLLQSNTFDTSWSTTNASVTGSQSGYDGTNNAWLLNESAVGGRVLQSISGSGVMTMSLYAKSGTLDFILVYINTTGTDPFAYFDLTNGDVSTSGASSRINASAVAVGDGWYRLTVTGNIGTLSSIEIYPANSLSSHTESAGSIYIQNAQLNSGTSAKTYFPTTTRLNMPRVSYLNNSNGSLILEPQRSNLVTYSSDFSNAAWTKSGTTITANNTTSPDGTTNADKIIASSGLSIKISYQVISSTNSVAHTVSAFYKADEYSYAFLRVGGQTPSPYVIYNLLNQSVVSTANATSTKIEDYGSGWYRVSMTYTANSATNAPNIAFLPTSGYTLDSANQPSYNGDGSSGGYIYGVQLEANASYPTTLINTSGSSVTRNADGCELTNASDSIGQTEGTIYGEFDFKDHSTGTRRLLCLTDGSSSNRITTYINGLDKLSVYIVNGGAAQADIQATVLTEGTIKYALAYANNSIKLYLNGTQVGTDTSATIPATSDFLVGFEYSGSPSYFNWKNCQIYNTALSDSELATLTTL